jgi:hypothetical protein
LFLSKYREQQAKDADAVTPYCSASYLYSVGLEILSVVQMPAIRLVAIPFLSRKYLSTESFIYEVKYAVNAFERCDGF